MHLFVLNGTHTILSQLELKAQTELTKLTLGNSEGLQIV